MFFFSSRRRHTRFDCDWSSDVCSSDLVFGTKFRRKILADLPLLRALLSRWRARWAAAGIEFGGEPDRIHFLLRYPPTVNLSAVVRTLKSRSASAYLNRFGAFYWRRHSRTRWSGGFFLCSVGGAKIGRAS